jgi:hypothetical protein
MYAIFKNDLVLHHLKQVTKLEQLKSCAKNFTHE